MTFSKLPLFHFRLKVSRKLSDNLNHFLLPLLEIDGCLAWLEIQNDFFENLRAIYRRAVQKALKGPMWENNAKISWFKIRKNARATNFYFYRHPTVSPLSNISGSWNALRTIFLLLPIPPPPNKLSYWKATFYVRISRQHFYEASLPRNKWLTSINHSIPALSASRSPERSSNR